MSITILSPGLFTTIQDAGRMGYQQYGFAPGGALDKRAMTMANLLVGNEPGEAVLEMTLLGAEMEFTQDNIIAVTGALCESTRNGEPVPMYTALLMRAGDTLAIGAVKEGCRIYAAFGGGLNVPTVMGSKSTQIKYGLGGFEGRALKAGDAIPFSKPQWDAVHFEKRVLPAPVRPSGVQTLRVVLGPQSDTFFTKEALDAFLKEEYAVTNESDRMGYRLEGKALSFINGADIISDAIALGSVQVPASGKPIVLLCDRQTVGGYAKIATVISVDIPVIAQCKMGDKVRFQAISVAASQRLYRKQEKQYRAFKKMLDGR
jgi:antagonist of KipI